MSANYLSGADIHALARDVRRGWTVASPAVWRCDAPRELVSGRWQSWRERLNRAIFAARTWEGLETIARRQARVLANRRVRCEVYEANNH